MSRGVSRDYLPPMKAYIVRQALSCQEMFAT